MANVIKPSVVIETPIDAEGVYQTLERIGRVAHKSENLIGVGTAESFIRMLLRVGHESVLEHVSLSVRFICDRGVTHELVRHRIAAYTQESTRYINYRRRGMEVIEPCFWPEGSEKYKVWRFAMEEAERLYSELLHLGAKPQEARSVLPNSLKTEIVATMNIRQWRHVLRLRTAKNAHPQMAEIMDILKAELVAKLPVLFGDLDGVEHREMP